MKSTKAISGIILAGGKSARMRQNKAFLEIDGVPIIHNIYSLFKDLFEEIIIVSDQIDLFYNFDVKLFSDIFPNKGVLGGLYTGIYHSSFHYSFCTACDMPFLNKSLIQHLIHYIKDEDVIIPRTYDGFQPLHAFYSKNCLGFMKQSIDQGSFKIINLFSSLNVRVINDNEFCFIDHYLDSFRNLNTPEDVDTLR